MALVTSDRAALTARRDRLAAELTRARAALVYAYTPARHKRVQRLERELIAVAVELRTLRELGL